MFVSVISALARRGFDPWAEAARLSALPELTAIQELAPLISTKPQGGQDPADALAIARRLVGLLPKRGQAAAPAKAGGSAQRRPAGRIDLGFWLVCALLVGAAFLGLAANDELPFGNHRSAVADYRAPSVPQARP